MCLLNLHNAPKNIKKKGGRFFVSLVHVTKYIMLLTFLLFVWDPSKDVRIIL